MQIKYRVGLLLTGAFMVLYGAEAYHKYGIFPYPNIQRQPVFPVGVVIFGFILAAIAFTPPASWLDRLFRRKHQKPEAHVLKLLHEHHRKDKSNS